MTQISPVLLSQLAGVVVATRRARGGKNSHKRTPRKVVVVAAAREKFSANYNRKIFYYHQPEPAEIPWQTSLAGCDVRQYCVRPDGRACLVWRRTLSFVGFLALKSSRTAAAATFAALFTHRRLRHPADLYQISARMLAQFGGAAAQAEESLF